MPKHLLRWHNSDDSQIEELFDGNIFMTSDNHYWHELMVKLRGFSSVDEMNYVMKDNWKHQVRNNDIVICHGDFSYGTPDQTLELLNELPGRKYLIEGNHDGPLLASPACRAMFCDIWVRKEMTIDMHRFVMDHYPIRRDWNRKRRGSFHTYGHIHSPYTAIANTEGRCMDVGVDSRPPNSQGYPDVLLWSLEEVVQLLSQKTIVY